MHILWILLFVSSTHLVLARRFGIPGPPPKECLDCRLVLVKCTEELTNDRCECSRDEVCCDNCCGGTSCVPRRIDDPICRDRICTTEYNPVCGSDGVKYGNLCRLDLTKRCDDPSLVQVEFSLCDEDTTEDPICTDRICILEHDPVCGSDGVTYRNPCSFNIAKRCDDPTLEQVDFSFCSIGIYERNLGGAVSKKQVPVCEQPILPGPCKASFLSWGFNSSTHECQEFIYGGCKGNENIFATIEECTDQCGDPTCKDRICSTEYNPVCGSDGVKYSSPCRFNLAKRCDDPSLEQVEFSFCDEETTEDPICTDRLCTQEYNPVCGSDGVTYSNPCFFDLAKRCDDPTLEQVEFSFCTNGIDKKIFLGSTGSKKQGPPPKECLDCRLVRVECTEELANDRCECSRNEVCCDNCCGGTSCVSRRESVPVCEQPIIPGPCEAYIPSWGFNSSAYECQEFIYGGCLGNENRFETIDDCTDRCVDPVCAARVCTKEYNPICGSDGVKYSNPCRFNLAKRCDDPTLKQVELSLCSNEIVEKKLGRPVDCALVRCIQQVCPPGQQPYVPKGKCCPICIPNDI